MAERTCSIDGCDRPLKARGVCAAHYRRWMLKGDPRAGGPLGWPRLPKVEDRFWQRTQKTAGCWLWLASKQTDGYGMFYDGVRQLVAHRYAYQLLIGPIPDGMLLDHLCRNRACVNPAHLRVVTNYENIMAPGSLSPAKANREKTHCMRGHAFTPENTYVRMGTRQCRACSRARA